MRIRWLRLYDDYNNRAVMGKEKNAARKANRGEVNKTFRLNSTVGFQQPGAQLQGHDHCAGIRKKGRRSNKRQHASSENKILEVWNSVPNEFKTMKALGIAFLTFFGSSYACERLF